MQSTYAYFREVQVSAGRRVIGLGPEMKMFIGNFLLHDPDSIAVRPIIRQGLTEGAKVLLALQFGPREILSRQKRDQHFPDGVGLGASDIPAKATFTVRTNTCPNYTFGYAVDTEE